MMKKPRSMPKLTPKTHITLTETHTISINSPKNQANALLERIFPPTSTNSKKTRINKADKSQVNLRPETANPTPSRQPHRELEAKPSHGLQIKKITQRLKVVEKRTNPIKSTSRTKNESTQRSVSKNTRSKAALDEKSAVERFENNVVSGRKMIKKSVSQKMLKLPAKREKKQELKRQLSHGNGLDQLVTQMMPIGRPVEAHLAPFRHFNLYYVEQLVEGEKGTIFWEHLSQSMQASGILRMIREPSIKELTRLYVNLPPTIHKYTVVLDLDETLIHCNSSTDIPHDKTLRIKFSSGDKIDAGINVRPYAQDFLKNLSRICEVIVFTASQSCYAEVVIDYLDPFKKWVSHRLFRNNCFCTDQNFYLKDLRVIKNRSLDNMLLVDNAALSYLRQMENGVPIIPFHADKGDTELIGLENYLRGLFHKCEINPANTLRQLNAKYFQTQEYYKYETEEALVRSLYQPLVKNQSRS